MQLVLRVWGSNSDRGLGFDYAIVEGGEAFLSLALRRINLLREQKALDSSLDEIRYWDLSAQYFNLSTDQESQADAETCSKLAESIDGLEVDKREAVLAATDFSVPEDCIGAVECAQMIVREEGIAFRALLKHSDTRVTTAEIPKGMIESALASTTN
jgi:hypothetical protein